MSHIIPNNVGAAAPTPSERGEDTDDIIVPLARSPSLSAGHHHLPISHPSENLINETDKAQDDHVDEELREEEDRDDDDEDEEEEGEDSSSSSSSSSAPITINKLRTSFVVYLDRRQREREILARWEQEDVYAKIMKMNEDKPLYHFVDGPPYANGPIHVGHAMNKILKDIGMKHLRMTGHYHVPYHPAWDCHGLPIQHDAATNMMMVKKHNTTIGSTAITTATATADDDENDDNKDCDKDKHNNNTTLQLIGACREQAQKWIATQSSQFVRLGVLGAFSLPSRPLPAALTTMSPSYQADILRSLATMHRRGLVERRSRPTHWCSTCNTTLASAEVEEGIRDGPTAYVSFPVYNHGDDGDDDDALALWRNINVNYDVCAHLSPPWSTLSVLVYTASPWSLPMNRAIAISPACTYTIILASSSPLSPSSLPSSSPPSSSSSLPSGLIVSTPSAPAVLQLLINEGVHAIIPPDIPPLSPSQLSTLRLRSPLTTVLEASQPIIPIVLHGGVYPDRGTGCLHVAPACSQEDYSIGEKNTLEMFSPIDTAAQYTDGFGVPSFLVGQDVLGAGDDVILSCLGSINSSSSSPVGRVLWQAGTMSRPHLVCSRCKDHVLYRATPQWFIDIRGSKGERRSSSPTSASSPSSSSSSPPSCPAPPSSSSSSPSSQPSSLVDLVLRRVNNTNNEDEDDDGRVLFHPQKVKQRFVSTLEGRAEWCVSRQRLWGVPISALLCSSSSTLCSHSLLLPDMMEAVAHRVASCGVEWWAKQRDVADLVAAGVLERSPECPACGGTSWQLERDVLDVWLDSAIMRHASLALIRSAGDNDDTQEKTAHHTVLIEGRDQHRGWFQHALLCDAALNNNNNQASSSSSSSSSSSPFSSSPTTTTIITHGFCLVDNSPPPPPRLPSVNHPHNQHRSYNAYKAANASSATAATPTLSSSVPPTPPLSTTATAVQEPPPSGAVKMSKSQGNGLSPDNYPADWIRLWTALQTPHGYTSDVVFSRDVMYNTSKEYRVMRRVFRFLLGNLYDFDHTQHTISLEDMHPLDQYVLAGLYDVSSKIQAWFREWDYGRAMRGIMEYIKSLRGGYLARVKRRLYFSPAACHARRSAQTAILEIVRVVTPLMAPVLSFMAEEISDIYQGASKTCSIHLQHYVEPVNVWQVLTSPTISLPSPSSTSSPVPPSTPLQLTTTTTTTIATTTEASKKNKKSIKAGGDHSNPIIPVFSLQDMWRFMEEAAKIANKALEAVKAVRPGLQRDEYHMVLELAVDNPQAKAWYAFVCSSETMARDRDEVMCELLNTTAYSLMWSTPIPTSPGEGEGAGGGGRLSVEGSKQQQRGRARGEGADKTKKGELAKKKSGSGPWLKVIIQMQ